MRFQTALFTLSLLYVLGSAQNAVAAGFYLQEQNVKGQGQSFAGAAANPQDASIIFYNPAGMTELKGRQAQAGVSVIMPSTEFTNTGSTAQSLFFPLAAYTGSNGDNPYSPTPIPSMYVAQPLAGGTYWVGLGINAPFGLSSEYEPGWFGRYDSTKNDLKTININPAIAVLFSDTVSLGAGVDIQYVKAELVNALPCPAVAIGCAAAFSPTTDGQSKLEGDSWSAGVNFGLFWKATPKMNVGVSYRSTAKHELEGTATVSGLIGPLAAGNGTDRITARLDLPQIVNTGITYDYSDRLRLSGSLNWYGWSSFEELRVISGGTTLTVLPENWRNTWAAAVGAEWKQDEKLTWRGGLQFDETPVTGADRATRVPDSNRFWVSAGASYKVNDRFSIDAAATHIFMTDTGVHVSRDFYTGTGLDSTVNINGSVESYVNILALQGVWRF